MSSHPPFHMQNGFAYTQNPKMWLFEYVRHWYIAAATAVAAAIVIIKRIILSITFAQELSINFQFLKLMQAWYCIPIEGIKLQSILRKNARAIRNENENVWARQLNVNAFIHFKDNNNWIQRIWQHYGNQHLFVNVDSTTYAYAISIIMSGKSDVVWNGKLKSIQLLASSIAPTQFSEIILYILFQFEIESNDLFRQMLFGWWKSGSNRINSSKSTNSVNANIMYITHTHILKLRCSKAHQPMFQHYRWRHRHTVTVAATKELSIRFSFTHSSVIENF